MQSEFFDSVLWTWVILPLLIFIARIGDVSIGTLRIIFIARGQKIIAPILGFFEIAIWLMAIQQIMQNITNPVAFIAYPAGFAFGNYVGIIIEGKLALGKVIVRIITQKDATLLLKAMRRYRFGVTNIPAQGNYGPVNVIYSIIERADLYKIDRLINKYNPKAFYTVEDIRYYKAGFFRKKTSPVERAIRKAKITRRKKYYRKFIFRK